MKAIERLKSWCRRTSVTENPSSQEPTSVSCTSCLPRTRSHGHEEEKRGADPNAGALADIKASNRKPGQKGIIPKVHFLHPAFIHASLLFCGDCLETVFVFEVLKYMSRSALDTSDFFAEYGEANRYVIKEIIGKGSYGVVCSAQDTLTGSKVAIKKITNVFDHVSDATRILREIKLLRMLRHSDIVEIKHIMLPPNPRDFKDIYVVFELMETDLHQVIKANDDLTPEHHQFFLYQMLRGLKYVHSARVYHRDLKPKNILANADCKLKICDFGLARPSLHDMPSTIYWTDYVATRWYRAPELCGSFFAKYSSAIDIWSVGCIFAEVLLGKPLFPGRNVVHQLELITDQLGTPPPEVIAKVKNEKARRFLSQMRHKNGVLFEQTFPKADKGALRLLRRMLEFDPAARPTAEEALADPYFNGLASPAREPTSTPISKLAFDFERRKLSVDEVRDLIYREILEYHPSAMNEFMADRKPPTRLLVPGPLDTFKWQFASYDGASALPVGSARPMHQSGGSIPRERVQEYQTEAAKFTSRLLAEDGKKPHDRARSIDSLGYGMRGMNVSDRMHPTYNTGAGASKAHPASRSNSMQQR